MLISPRKSATYQRTPFGEPLGNHGHVRYILGDITERLTAKLLGGELHKDATGYYCPDVSTRGVYIECKAAGRSRQTFIYSGRLDRDYEFSKTHKLIYAIWHHLTDTSKAETVEELQFLFLHNLKALYLVPFEDIYALALSMGEKPLNGAYGKHSSEKIYSSGYRIPLGKLAPFLALEVDHE